MSVRAKVILLSVLCIFALGATMLAAASTYKAFQAWHQHYLMVQAGDVRTIRPWMTLPFIARVYHVPADYLYQWLDVQDTPSTHHVTLNDIAEREHKPVDQVIQSVQEAIITYRSQHSQPSPSPHVLLQICLGPPICWQNGGLKR